MGKPVILDYHEWYYKINPWESPKEKDSLYHCSRYFVTINLLK